MFEVILHFERETKNTVRYNQNTKDGLIVYFPKANFGGRYPDRVKVRVEAA